jgi:hypothetical protein
LGAVKTCGCSWSENGKKTIALAQAANNKYGHLANTRLYIIWGNIKQRCSDTNNKDYGGRGISICQEWKDDFKTFYDWAIANGYSDNLTIDRIDVNGNYEPLNCRWATAREQANNTRKNVFITYKGETRTASQWANECDVPLSTFMRWLKQGESIEDIFYQKCAGHRERLHKCEICGTSFVSHSHKSKYCSDDCKRTGENQKQQIRRRRVA